MFSVNFIIAVVKFSLYKNEHPASKQAWRSVSVANGVDLVLTRVRPRLWQVPEVSMEDVREITRVDRIGALPLLRWWHVHNVSPNHLPLPARRALAHPRSWP